MKTRFLILSCMAIAICFFGCKDDKDDASITISTQPVDASIMEGSISGSLTISASVTQGATLTYQWFANTSNNNSGGTIITGATEATFAIPTDLTTGDYYYYCIVSATGAVSVTSNVAKVTVSARPVITIIAQPAGTSVTEGSISGSLTVAASVTQGATITYQWYKNTSNSNSGGTAITSATDATFDIPTELTEGVYYYYCMLSATGAVSVTSSVVTVTVNPIVIVEYPMNLTVGWEENITSEIIDDYLKIVTTSFNVPFTIQTINPNDQIDHSSASKVTLSFDYKNNRTCPTAQLVFMDAGFVSNTIVCEVPHAPNWTNFEIDVTEPFSRRIVAYVALRVWMAPDDGNGPYEICLKNMKLIVQN